MMVNRWQRYIFPAALLGAGLLGYLITTNAASDNRSSIEVDVVPGSTKITIDQKGASDGVNNIPAGDHIVKAEKNGFKTQTKNVKTHEGERVFVGFSLEPSSDKTRNWYDKHPADRKSAENISSRDFDQQVDAATQQNTLLQALPVTFIDGQNTIIDIDQGVSVKGSDQPAIYVSANTAAARRVAIQWIRDQGYDPSDMDIVFYDEINYLKPAVKSSE